MHADALPLDDDVVRRLIARQFPDWSDRPVRALPTTGSTNTMFRLGDDLLLRLPRQPGGGESILKEARWTPVLSEHLPVPVPDVVAVGEPDEDFPERWSVVRLLPGSTPRAGEGGGELARDLARTVVALGELAVPDDAITDPGLRWYRGDPLPAFDSSFRHWLAACRTMPQLDLDLDTAEEIWEDAVALPLQPVIEPRWLHADLLAENLLVVDRRLSGVLDLGALTVGDPTADLIVAWEVLDATAREVFRREVGAGDATWLRGRAWALAIAIMTFPYYWDSMPGRCADRLVMARAALAG